MLSSGLHEGTLYILTTISNDDEVISNGDIRIDHENECTKEKTQFSNDNISRAICGGSEPKSLDSILFDMTDSYEDAVTGPEVKTS